MHEPDDSTLMMAIHAVRLEIARLESMLASEPGDAADIQDVLLAYERAAFDLKTVYEKRCAPGLNLLPYEELVHLRGPALRGG